MMKIVSFLILGLALASAMPLSDEVEWQNFKNLHQKTYETPEEEARRFENFKENLKTIRENNEKFQNGESSFLMGVNEFSDMTPEEFQAFHGKGILGMSALKDEEEWQKFKKLHHKYYETHEEETRRFEIFKENLKAIQENNERFENGETSFQMGVNQFSDMTPEEFEAFLHKGLLKISPKSEEEEWQKFKKLNHKYYETHEEEARRFEIFKENLKAIQENNERFQNGETSFQMGVNQFSDMTPEEFEAFLHKGLLKISPKTEEEEWQKFKKLHHKYYETSEEEARRFEIFRENLKAIREHNEKFEKGEATYKIGVNKFSDLTPEEFNAIYGTGILLSDIEEWQKFKNLHNKLYESPEEEARRFEIFKDKLRQVREHNAKFARGETTFLMTLNKFSDMTTEEFKAMYANGLLPRKE